MPFFLLKISTKCFIKFLFKLLMVINFKVYLGSSSKATADREKKRRRWKYKNLKGPITKGPTTFSLNISGTIYILWLSFVLSLKWLGIFLTFFQNFHVFGLLRGSKGKKWPKMTKNSVLCSLYLRNHTSYDLDLCCTCVKG